MGCENGQRKVRRQRHFPYDCMVIAVEKGKRNANRCKTHAVNHVNAVYNDMETVSAFCIGILHIFPENTHRLPRK